MTLSRSSMYNCTPSNNSTSPASNDLQQDLHAVLYIVVTLLFYSLGIIIGIVLYLKREKQECEEDKLFEEFIALREDPNSAFRYEQVQQMTARLNYLEEQKIKQKGLETVGGAHSQKKPSLLQHKAERVVQEEDISGSIKLKKNIKFVSVSVQTMGDSNVFSENGQALSSVVEKLLKVQNVTSEDSNLNENELNDIPTTGVPQTFSMQSIKEYEEEPRRSERSSMCSLDDECAKEDTELLHEKVPESCDLESQGRRSEESLTRGLVTNV
ncbi:hypothetical protein FSP39_004259 [Pinctada imbricata]|uniref:Uncharacterized protein n=1 Tax=Pinctada imbricata TaxID=66713 RepID=A0AA88XYM3_PINIB|nr:hypothetical protein FSP39_004259 [Pinctada imbricata]